MPFDQTIKEEALVRSKRHCCLCHKFGGRNVNVHHIIPEAAGGPNTLNNAIVLCLTCHADVGHYNPQHPLGLKFRPDEIKRHRDMWWETCSSGTVLLKEVSCDFLSKQHDIIFWNWNQDQRDLSRILRAKGRYNSTYGMRQFAELVLRYVTEFLSTIEKDLASETGAGTAANLQKIILGLLHSDQKFLVEKLTVAFPDRAGTSFLKNVLDEGKAAIKNQYNKFSLKNFGSLAED